MNTPWRAVARAALGFSLALMSLAGCGRVPEADTPPAQQATAPAPEREDSRVALARRLYEALSRGDAQPIEDRLAPEGYDVMVDGGTGEEGPYSDSRQGGESPDWSPLLGWAERRPPSTIRRVHAASSPHEPNNVMVTLELNQGYFYLLFTGDTITKIVATVLPAEWD